MPLEDLTGNKYIDDLNSAWPLSATDTLDITAPNLRGIKNILQKTFPNLSGAVTRTATSLNTGSVPSGSVMYFYMAAAPTGWSRIVLGTTHSLMAVSVEPAGATHGVHIPTTMNMVPSHTHVVTGTTGSQSTGHQHNFTTSSAGAHTHTIPRGSSTGFNECISIGSVTGTATTSSAGAHTHTGTTDYSSSSHTHSVNLTSAANAGAANWQPLYMGVIVCTRN